MECCDCGDPCDSSSDEYLPDSHRTCGIDGCTEDVFIACEHCPNFLCYDHIPTSCSVHCNSKQQFDMSEDQSRRKDPPYPPFGGGGLTHAQGPHVAYEKIFF